MDLSHLTWVFAIGVGAVLAGLGYLIAGQVGAIVGFFLGAVGYDVWLRLHSHEEDRWLRGEEGAHWNGAPVWLLCIVLPLVIGLLILTDVI